MSYWQCLTVSYLPYWSISISLDPICQLLSQNHWCSVEENCLLYQCVHSYFRCSLLIYLVYLGICWGLWSIQTWILCGVIYMDIFSFFCMGTSGKTSSIYSRYISSSMVCFCILYQKPIVNMRVDSFQHLQLYFSVKPVYFYTKIIQFSLLLLCSTTWGQRWWSFQKLFYCLGIF